MQKFICHHYPDSNPVFVDTGLYCERELREITTLKIICPSENFQVENGKRGLILSQFALSKILFASCNILSTLWPPHIGNNLSPPPQ